MPSPADDGTPRPRSRTALAGLVVLSLAVPAGLLAYIVGRDDRDPAGPRDQVMTRSGPLPPGVMPYDRAKASPGEVAPDFELPSVAGERVRLSQFRGRAVVLTFFASWCYSCREEFTALEVFSREHSDRLAVVAVSYHDFPDDSRAFVRRMKATFPALLDDDAESPVAASYGVRGIPTTFFIDADGVIAGNPLFGASGRDELQPRIDALLR
jgi:peroxiredoxin